MARKTINVWTLDKSPMGKLWKSIYSHASDRSSKINRNTITVLAKVYYDMLNQFGEQAARDGLRLIVSGNYYNQK
jgi:hypothetical protein